VSARYSPGQILLAALAFSNQAGVKRRPVVGLYDGGDDDLLVAPITSHAARSAHDLSLSEWRQAGLRLPSIARLEKLATVEKGTIIRPLGQVSGADRQQFKSAIQAIFATILSGW